MRISRILLGATCLLAVTLCFDACKKNSDRKPVCRISAFTLAGQVYHISYNGEGKIISLTGGNLSDTYDYFGNTTIVTTLDAGAFSSKTIITANPAGLATNVRTELNASGSDWTNDSLEYNGDELAKKISTTSVSTGKDTTTYTWFNHNMISETTGTNVTSLAYDAARPKQNGDYLAFIELISGYQMFRNKNLLKSFGGADLTYDFGSDGNIASLTISSPGGTPASINYEYECK
jgi:hypothetical protein